MKALVLTIRKAKRAYTLIEVTLVVAILLGLITVLFVGVAAYKKGADRAFCIQNISNVQKAVRSYSNLYGLNPGDTMSGLQAEVMGPGKFIEATPTCPSGGAYTFGGDNVPLASEAYLSCSIGDHVPSSISGW